MNGRPSKLRMAVVALAFIVGYWASMVVGALTGFDDHSLGTAPVNCAEVDYSPVPCEPGEVLYRIVGVRWPPIAAYAMLGGLAAAAVAFGFTRKGVANGDADVDAEAQTAAP